MLSPTSEFATINRKLNFLLAFILLALVIPFAMSLLMPNRIAPLNPMAGAWNIGRPFAADFEGSQEQRRLVEMAKAANGVEAAKINLHVLNLTGLTLTAEDFETLGSMKDLRELKLKKTNIQDQDLAQLTGLFQLESLDLSETAVTDASLPIVQKFRNLRTLEVTQSQITVNGVKILHANMPELHARLYGFQSRHHGNAIQATIGKYVLVKYGSERIAFRFTELTTTGDGGAKYIWHWQPAATGAFQDATIKTGEGEVFEKYRKFKGAGGNNIVENDGGELNMTMGPAKLQWSKSLVVYYPHDREVAPRVLLAFTEWERLNEIRFDDQSLRWLEKTDR